MNADERYDARVKLCKELRVVENNLEEVRSIQETYKQTKEKDSRKFTISVYVSGKSMKYDLDKKMADRCLSSIIDSLLMQREEDIRKLDQLMK